MATNCAGVPLAKLLLGLLLLVSLGAMAADHPHGRFGSIQLLRANGTLIMDVADIAVQAGTTRDETDDLNSLAENFRKSLAEARGHAALTAALKNYYSALRTFLNGLEPQAGEVTLVYQARVSGLETNAKSAGERLDVELQALGVDP